MAQSALFAVWQEFQQMETAPALAGAVRLSKKFKSVAVGGPAPTMATPTGKFCGKLCARSEATSARFPVKFCREGFQKGEPDDQAKPCRTGPPFAACRVSRHAEMGNPDPGLPIDLQRIPLFSAPIVTGLVQSLRSASPLSAQRTGLAAPYWSMGFIVGTEKTSRLLGY